MKLSLENAPPELLLSGDFRQALANCYAYYQSNLNEVHNSIRVNPERATLHFNVRGAIATHFSSTMKYPIGMLRCTDNEEYGVRVIAMLDALADHIYDFYPNGEFVSADERLGGMNYYVARRPKTLLDVIGQASLAPRSEQIPGDGAISFHRKLSLVPLSCGPWTIQRISLPISTNGLLRYRAKHSTLGIGMSSMTTDVQIIPDTPDPRFPSQQPVRFVFSGLAPEAKEEEDLIELLKKCREQEVAILVLPELRVSPKLLQAIKRFLSQQTYRACRQGKGLCLVVAGSWHASAGQHKTNRCVVLDWDGTELWTHDKLIPYNITKKNVEREPELRKFLGLNELGGIEGIACGGTLQIADTYIGRLSTAVCAGFQHTSLRHLFALADTTVFLVPAMTTDTNPLIQMAESLVRQTAATFVANCGALGEKREPPALCFYKIPARKQKISSSLSDNRLLIYELKP